ncbi:MAG: redox-regulated ATPase YchF [Acidobacteriota bacterium]|nr:redox-regulated ATPase YchF [Acidobacteriota bacterium]
MQLGITGLAKTGKTTLFNLLTSSHEATDKFAKSTESHVAIAKVPDRRLDALATLYEPQKLTPATIQFVDIPGVEHRAGGFDLNLVQLREVDALVHVVRAFEDPDILHPQGSIDTARDIASLDLDLILADLEIVERRLARLEQSQKRGLTADEARERELLDETIRPALEAETPLRTMELADAAERRLRGFQLLSAKPMLVVLNVAEDELGAASQVPSVGSGPAREVVVMSLPIEDEIAQLPPAEQRDFLSALGLEQASLDRAIRAAYHLLGLISFFTVGQDEVRAWTIRRGTSARRAGAAIHSDIERGFIRAEVVPWEEILERKSIAACRDAGTLRLEGKEYVVADGEIVHFRFNV